MAQRKKPIEQYDHRDKKRLNNPPVGLVTPETDPDLIEAYRRTVSLPFEPGENRRVAVKIIDDRGIESLKIVDL